MVPEVFEGVNKLVKVPDGVPHDMGPVYPIPMKVGHNVSMSIWRPSREEIALLSGGGVVLLTALVADERTYQVEVMQTRVADSGMAQA
jgi:hypothetical protein